MPGKTPWLRTRRNEPYHKQSKVDGFASRAAYKLQQIDDKHRLLPSKGTVLDLCCAPGSWAEYITRAHKVVKVVGVDLQHVREFPNFTFVKHDILAPDLFDAIEQVMARPPPFFDAVLSDCAPKFSGARDVDLFRQHELAVRAVECCEKFLVTGGSCVIKYFQGLPDEERELLGSLRASFTTVRRAKPDSSQQQSPEFYFVGTGKK